MRYTTRIIVPPRIKRSGTPGNPGTGPRPQVLGVRKSLGFGDPLGLGAPIHVAIAAAHSDFVPFLAQSSGAGERTPGQILTAATQAVSAARFRGVWGADADGLRTPADANAAAEAGYTYFTIDLASEVRDDTTQMSAGDVTAAAAALVADGILPENWAAPYLGREVDVPGLSQLILTEEPLALAAVRFAHAIRYAERMYETVVRANRGRAFEVEISLAGLGAPVTVIEHLFLGLEMEARGVRLTGLAPTLARDTATFEAALREHVAIAFFCGPYKLCFRTADLTPDLCRVVGRVAGDHFHLKTWNESADAALDAAREVAPERFLDGTVPDLDALLELLASHTDVYQEMLTSRFAALIGSFNAG